MYLVFKDLWIKVSTALVKTICRTIGPTKRPLFNRKPDNVETTTLMVERDGLYDVSVHKMLSESELRPETVFECELSIPGTSYVAREETMYFPGKGEIIFISRKQIQM